MGKDEAEYVSNRVLELNPDLILYTTPNASAPGPKKAISAFAGKPVIVVSDAPAVKSKDLIEKHGLGYILVKADAMIGARREFLDPTEMAVFNADMLKVLAGTGALRLIQIELGKTIDALKQYEKYLPKVVVTAENAVEHANYSDPAAREKAVSAYNMCVEVGGMNVRGCFMEKEPAKYIQTVSDAHELLRKATTLIDEAREIERKSDTLYRTPHSPDGRILRKTRLMEKPE